MQLAQSPCQTGSCCLLIVQTESRGSENERQRHAQPKQQPRDNSPTLRAPCLCSPSPFPGGTPRDCLGGQLGAITTPTYLIRSLQTVRSGDSCRPVWPREPGGEPPPSVRAPTGFQPWLHMETRCPRPSPRSSDIVATWTRGSAKVPRYSLLLSNKSSQNSVASDNSNHFLFSSLLRFLLDENRGGGWLGSS